MSLAAFLLCAGYGQRLRPLTERIAKPALTFQGKSALEINKRRVEVLKPEHWLANAHHLPEQITSLAKRLDLEVLHEHEILGTGGCLFNAASVLKTCDHFLVHNADLIHTIDLQNLFARHLSSGAMATLAGIHHPNHNTLSVSKDGRLRGIRGYKEFEAGSKETRLTFTGIAFYQRNFLRFANPGPHDIKHPWTQALNAEAFIQVVDCSGASWHDFGTPQGLWDAAKFMMESTGEFSYHYPAPPGERPNRSYVSNEAGQKGLPEGLMNVLIYEEMLFSSLLNKTDRIFGRDFEWMIKA